MSLSVGMMTILSTVVWFVPTDPSLALSQYKMFGMVCLANSRHPGHKPGPAMKNHGATCV